MITLCTRIIKSGSFTYICKAKTGKDLFSIKRIDNTDSNNIVISYPITNGNRNNKEAFRIEDIPTLVFDFE